VFILKEVKVVCFDTLLQVLILNGLGLKIDGALERFLEKWADIEISRSKEIGLSGDSRGRRGMLLNDKIVADSNFTVKVNVADCGSEVVSFRLSYYTFK
jgi:hypothetical protein